MNRWAKCALPPAAFLGAIGVASCFTHPLFGSGPTYSFSGASESGPPVHDLVPGGDDPNGAQPLFLRHREAGVDAGGDR